MRKIIISTLLASVTIASTAHSKDTVWFQANVIHVSGAIAPVATFHSVGAGSAEKNFTACKLFVGAFLSQVQPTEFTLACTISDLNPEGMQEQEVHVR